MAVTGQFLLGPMVNAVPSSARGCRKAGLIRLSLGPLTCLQSTASLPVPKQAPDSPNPINRNSTSVSTSTTHGTLTESMWRRLSCSRCRKPWTSSVHIRCMCVYYPDIYYRTLRRKAQAGTSNVKIHKMQIQVTCAASKCKPIRFKFCMRGFPITAQYPTKAQGPLKISIFNFSHVRYWHPTEHGQVHNTCAEARAGKEICRQVGQKSF